MTLVAILDADREGYLRSYETEHGDISLPGPNQDLQTNNYHFEGKSFLIRRDQEEEEALLTTLMDMRFQLRSSSMWFLEPEEAIAFLLDAYPKLVEAYRVYDEKISGAMASRESSSEKPHSLSISPATSTSVIEDRKSVV